MPAQRAGEPQNIGRRRDPPQAIDQRQRALTSLIITLTARYACKASSTAFGLDATIFKSARAHVPFHLADAFHQLIEMSLIHHRYPSSTPAALCAGARS
jgi:hypothetical protein